jgi:hypothetical protein
MVNKNIPALPDAHALDGTETFHGNQGNDSREITVDQISEYIQGLQQETHVTLAGDQAVAVSTLTKVDWDTETRDESGWHESVTNKDRMTTGAGIFDAVAKIHLITLAADATWGVEIGRYNSSAVLQEVVSEDSGTISAAGDIVVTPTALNVRMNAGDFLRVSVISSDTSYSVESDDSYFMVRTAQTLSRASASLFTKVELTSQEVVTANTAVVWDQVREVNGPPMWVSGSPTRLTIPESGVYAFGFQLDTTATTDQDFPGVWKNGDAISSATSAQALSQTGDVATSSPRITTISSVGVFVKDDYLEAGMLTFGATLDVSNNTCFWLARLDAGHLPARKILATGNELTIATGAITVTHSRHTVDTEADAASDDLATINGGVDGMELTIRAADSARSVVVKDGTGNIQCAGDFTMDHVNDTIRLMFDDGLSAWVEVSRSDNST